MEQVVTIGPFFARLDECVEAAPGRELLARAEAVTNLVDALEETPALATAATRRMAIGELRRHLIRSLSQIPLGEPDGPARAATALELFVSICDTPPNVDEDYPGMRARVRRIGKRMGLDRRMKKRLRNRILFEFYGDMFVEARPAHMLRAFFDLCEGDVPVLSDRARELCGVLLTRLMSNLDHFLWFHARAREPARFERVFADNEPVAVAELLADLLRDDACLRVMLDDEDLRHGGRTRLISWVHEHSGIDQLRRLLRELKPTRSVEMAGGLNTLHRARSLGTAELPTICIDLLPDLPGIDHQIPLVEERRGYTRVMTPAEIEAYRDGVRACGFDTRVANLLDRAALQAAVPRVSEPTLYTLAAYLVSIRPQDQGLREEAWQRRVSGPRTGAMRMIENVLSLLAPGDLLLLFGRSVVPYLRGVGWVNAVVNTKGALSLRGLGYRVGFPGTRLRWELT